MRRLFFISAWLRAFARCPIFPGDAGWDGDDANRWRNFLQSETGRRMSGALTNAAIREAFRSTQVVKGADYDAGYAAGFRGCVAYLQALSASASPQEGALSEETAAQGAVESAIPTP